jgi:hypothetical protein
MPEGEFGDGSGLVFGLAFADAVCEHFKGSAELVGDGFAKEIDHRGLL